MNNGQYIRKSETGTAMAEYCKANGVPFAVVPPGSKGHPFLMVTVDGKSVRIPFSLTPSDTNAPKSAVQALKRVLRGDALGDAGEAWSIEASETGAPRPPASAVIGKRGIRGPKGMTDAYRAARDAFIAKRYQDGATPQVIAAEITAAGVPYSAKSVNVAGFRLRNTGALPSGFPIPAVQSPRRVKKRAKTIERELLAAPSVPSDLAMCHTDQSEDEKYTKCYSELDEMWTNWRLNRGLDVDTASGILMRQIPKNGWTNQLEKARREAASHTSILDRMRAARTESAQAADDLARVLYEEIADARRAVEIELVQIEQDAKHAAILDALTK